MISKNLLKPNLTILGNQLKFENKSNLSKARSEIGPEALGEVFCCYKRMPERLMEFSLQNLKTRSNVSAAHSGNEI